jgi:linoleoyl-CoA desaturase
MQKVSFDRNKNSFFLALKAKVDRYFADNRIEQSGNRKLYIKSSIQVGSAIILYVALLFFQLPLIVSILGAVLLGFNLAILGFNIMHEGGHQSFSKYSWLNSVAAYFLNALGGNTYYWKIKHNINHHTFTNIEGIDADINVEPFMRLHPNQPLHKLHRYQHIYWVILYGISYVAWVFYDDFVKYFSRKVAPHMEAKSLSKREQLIFWITKVCYVVIYIAMPIFMLGWVKGIIGFFMVTFVTGLFISVVFQLAHVVEITEFPQQKEIEKEWAVHQISTTSNFATNNTILFWLLGGLNFQVEHHLFPRISHIHYPQISKLVKETCREFNVTYNEYTSMSKAFLSHLLYLRRMGIA